MSDDIMEDIFADLGVEKPKPLTQEDEYIDYLTCDKHQKIYNMQYWLKNQLYVYTHILSKNIIVSKIANIGKGPQRVQVSIREVTRVLLEYYLQMTALPRFQGHNACSMERVLDLLLERQEIRSVIQKIQTEHLTG